MQPIARQTATHAHLANIRAAVVQAGYHTQHRDGHERIEVTGTVRVVTNCGAGVLTSLTDDGWCECQLDGETRRDEYAIEHIELAA